jgi:cell division protein ZapB
MHAELDTLEAKIRQVADLCHTPAAREYFPAPATSCCAQHENKQMNTRLEAAKSRLAGTARNQLPEDA